MGGRQILTCNDWWDQYALLSPAQQQWLDGNVIVIDVNYPLYTNVPLDGNADQPLGEEVADAAEGDDNDIHLPTDDEAN